MVVGGLTFEQRHRQGGRARPRPQRRVPRSARWCSASCCAAASATAFFPHAFCPRWRSSVVLGALAWLVEELVAPTERVADVLVLAAIGLVGGRRVRRSSCASCPSGVLGWRPRSSRSIPTSPSNRDPPARSARRSPPPPSSPSRASVRRCGGADAATTPVRAGEWRRRVVQRVLVDLAAGDVVGRRRGGRRPQPPAVARRLRRRRHGHARRRAQELDRGWLHRRSAPADARRRSRRSRRRRSRRPSRTARAPPATVYRQRTGLTATGGLVHLGIDELVRENAEGLYDPTIGAFGDALAGHEVPRAVIANGDGAQPVVDDPLPEFQRAAVNALMDSDGQVPDGAVGTELLEPDPHAPFGVRMDNDAAYRCVLTRLGRRRCRAGRGFRSPPRRSLHRVPHRRRGSRPEAGRAAPHRRARRPHARRRRPRARRRVRGEPGVAAHAARASRSPGSARRASRPSCCARPPAGATASSTWSTSRRPSSTCSATRPPPTWRAAR